MTLKAAVLLAAVLLSASAAQAPIRCVNDWRAASFGEPLVRQIAADIAGDCADSSRIQWDRHLAEIGQAISAWSYDAKMTADLRKLERMLRQEREHLRTERARQAAAPAPPPVSVPVLTPVPTRPDPPTARVTSPPGGDSSVRFLSPDSALRGPRSRAIAVSVAPVFRWWVPESWRRDYEARQKFNVTIKSFRGDVSIRHGDRVIALRDLPSSKITIRPDTVFMTGPDGHIEFESEDDGSTHDDGDRTWSHGPNTEFMLVENCMFGGDIVRFSSSDERMRTLMPHLIRGSAMWASTGHRPQSCPNAIRMPHGIGIVRGTAFTATYLPGGAGDELTLAVQSGAVTFTDMLGETATVVAGATRSFRFAAVVPLRAEDPVARAILSGEPVADGQRLFVPMGAAGVWLDVTFWTPEPPEKLSRSYVRPGMARVTISGLPDAIAGEELWKMPADDAKRLGFRNPTIFREWRKLRGLKILYFEISETGSPAVIGQYFSGAQGTTLLQLMAWGMSVDALRNWQRGTTSLVLNVLNGFVAVDPESLPGMSTRAGAQSTPKPENRTDPLVAVEAVKVEECLSKEVSFQDKVMNAGSSTVRRTYQAESCLAIANDYLIPWKRVGEPDRDANLELALRLFKQACDLGNESGCREYARRRR